MAHVFSPLSVTPKMLLFFWWSWCKLQRRSCTVLSNLKTWLHKHARARQNTASFGLHRCPCWLPTRIQFAFGPQHGRATNIRLCVSNRSNIYKPSGGGIAEEKEQLTPLKYIIILGVLFSSVGGVLQYKRLFYKQYYKVYEQSNLTHWTWEPSVLFSVDRLPLQ